MIPAGTLKEAIDLVKGPALRKQSLPICSAIHVEQNGGLTLTATNLEMGVRVRTEAQGEEFTACLPAYALRDYVGEASNTVTFEPMDGHNMRLESGTGTQEIAGYDPGDFPTWEDDGGAHGFDVPITDFIKAVQSIIHACASSNNRFNLNGVFFDGKRGTLVATDGHRLAKAKVDWLPKGVTWIVPAKDLKEAIRILGKVKRYETVNLQWSTKHIRLEAGPVEITIRLIDGEYPKYQKVLLKKSKDKATFDKREFETGIKLAKLMNQRDITLAFGERSVVFGAIGEDGTSSHRVYGDVPTKMRGLVMKVNPKLLTQNVTKAKGGVTIHNPAWDNPEEPDGGIWINDQIVMPMRGKPKLPDSVPTELDTAPTVRPAKKSKAKPKRKTKQRTAAKPRAQQPAWKYQVDAIAAREYRHKKSGSVVLIGERDGGLFRWMPETVRKDGVKVRGHWRSIKQVPQTVK